MVSPLAVLELTIFVVNILLSYKSVANPIFRPFIGTEQERITSEGIAKEKKITFQIHHINLFPLLFTETDVYDVSDFFAASLHLNIYGFAKYGSQV